VYELLAKYAAKIVRIEAWPEGDREDTDGGVDVTYVPAPQVGAHE
jgi:hypothetical protein